tara:strand:+ start:6871 stop:7248 length:378 start_codon:yes stop_codon:yes gene_type:complete
MKTFKDIQFTVSNSICPSNGMIVLDLKKDMGPLLLSVSYGEHIMGKGPIKNTYEIALFTKEYTQAFQKNEKFSHEKKNMLQLSDYDDIIGFVSSEQITEFMNIIQTTTKLKYIKEHFRDNYSDED